MFVDSHCHLDFPEFSASLNDVLTAMQTAGVTHALSAGVDTATFPALHALIAPHPQLVCSVGLHPEYTDSDEVNVETLVAYARLPKVVAIGETGLDYFHVPDGATGGAEWQRERFRVHIAAARQARKPLIIHMRNATEDTLRILKEEGADTVGGVMHCFSEGWDAAEAALALGFYISFSGIVTFKNATLIKEAAQRVPLDRLLIETDSPYLAPVPYRGRYPNQPAWVVHVAEELARLREMPLADIARATTDNFFRLFGLPSSI